VALGLGPGRATLDFARHLGYLLHSEIQIPRIKLFCVCAGSPAESPEFAPVSFFNLMPRNVISGCIGLFAENLVPQEDFEAIKGRPGVVEAFEARREIDIVVTSMGDFDDEHDLFRMFLEKSGVDIQMLQAQGWVGSVQYRPYTRSKPVTEKRGELRAVTLFELSDFVKLAHEEDKHVVLIARQCGVCGRTRAAALRPLLEIPELRVWRQIVMDTATANELVSRGRKMKK
jgi:DNA-binding transcriptional regulator LsrR (DeoR family)